ncbi:MAG: glycosyltransferase [Planctomycetaceae bacterium]
MQQLVIVDPELKSFHGHYLGYNNTVAEAAARQGYSVKTLASSYCLRSLPCKFECIPCFRHDFGHWRIAPGWTRRFGALRRLNLRLCGDEFLRDLRAAEQHVAFDAQTLVFVPSVIEGLIRPLIRWLEGFAPERRPRLMILLRYAPSVNAFQPKCAQADDYARALAQIEQSAARDRITLYTDSELLRQEYGALTSLPIVVTPIPHTASEGGALPAEPDASTGGRSMTFLGPARWAKGFQYLPYVVRRSLQEFRSGHWSAEFQAHITHAIEAECLWARAELRRLPVTLYERELSPAEYWGILLRSSLVIFPYQHAYYYAQTSGVLCEALSAGKAVVVPRGTWMARQIKGRNVGQTFIPGDRVSLADAVALAMEHIDEHLAEAKKLRPEWVGYHNPDSFFRSLTSGVAA